jgi:transcriptional regulator with XRE-family HTH domain
MEDVALSIRRIGEQISELRSAKAWTIEQLAEKAGVSAGLISQLEHGNGNPSFGTLNNIARGLGIPVGTFFSAPVVSDQYASLVRRDMRKHLSMRSDSPVYELLTPDLNRRVEVVWVEFRPGVSTEEYPYEHEGEECGVIIEGTLLIHIGNQTYEAGPGDSITFPSTIPHWYENTGDRTVRGIWVTCPPSW